MRDVYDVVVIGSGFGGAVAACRLAEAGRSVCLLERGRWYGMGSFPRTVAGMRRALWTRDSYGLLDYRTYHDIDVVAASGVGGGSLIYANALIEPQPQVFLKGWPTGLTREVLTPYYERVKGMLGATPLPQRLSQPKTEAFRQAARRLRREDRWSRVNLAITFGEKEGLQKPNRFGALQTTCVHCGDCIIGCNIHAKNTLDLNYVKQAQNHGAEVFALHEAHKIERTAQGYKVHFRDLEKKADGTVTGRKVVVSAGMLGSTELLLKCKNTHKTLPDISPMLGQRFSGNGDFFGAVLNSKQTTDPSNGPTITSGLEFWDKGFIVEEAGFPTIFSWYAQGAIPTLGYVRRILRFLRSYIGRWLGFSRASRFSSDIGQLLRGEGVALKALVLLVVGWDASDGAAALDERGQLIVHWDNRGSLRLFNNIVKTLKRIGRALGGRVIINPTWTWPMRKPITVHPLGGCTMGDSKETGVVDQWGEVFGYPNLYVADASIIPRALGTNPSLTIAALAERIAERINRSF